MLLESPLLLIFPAAMAFAASMDLLTMTIPNRISLALLAGFAIAVPVTGMSWEQLGSHLGAFVLVLSCTITMFALGWMGGGDAKLIAAASLWVGFENLLMFLAQVAALGGVLAIVILAYRAYPLAALPIPDWAARLHKAGGGIPYGIAIAGGALLIYPQTYWFTAVGG